MIERRYDGFVPGQHLIDAYACLVPTVRRTRTAPARDKVGRPQVQALMAKR